MNISQEKAFGKEFLRKSLFFLFYIGKNWFGSKRTTKFENEYDVFFSYLIQSSVRESFAGGAYEV